MGALLVAAVCGDALGFTSPRLTYLFPLESLLESADSHVEDAGLDNAFIVGADEREVVGCQFEGHLAALARLQQDFCESLETLQRWRHARKALVQIQLNDFLAGAATAVFHRHFNVYSSASRSHGWSNAQIGIGKTRVAQPRSKFELRRGHCLA